MWVRGLKYAIAGRCWRMIRRIHVSAWIEMRHTISNGPYSWSRIHVSAWIEIAILYPNARLLTVASMWVRGLKFGRMYCIASLLSSHPCECVDWNHDIITDTEEHWRRIHVSAWIEMSNNTRNFHADICRIHVSAWIEINHIVNLLSRIKSHPCECVDWNRCWVERLWRLCVASMWVRGLK